MRSALVAICHNGPVVFTKTAMSLMEFGWGDRIPYTREKLGFDRIALRWFVGAPRVDMLRNQAVTAALYGVGQGDERQPFTHLVFLDADMIWPTTAVYDLLKHHDKGIVAGLYVLKGPPFSPAHLVAPFEEDGLTKYYRLLEYGNELTPCNVVGMGCTVIPVQAFRDIGDRNWFEYGADRDGWPIVSEDVTFCQKAAAKGYAISCDPTIKCGHVGVTVFDEKMHKRYQHSVEASQEYGATVEMARKGA